MKWLYSLLLVSATSLSAQTKTPVRPLAIATVSSATKMINFKLSWTQTEVVDSTMVAVFLSRDTVPVLYRRTNPIDTVSFSIPDDTTTYRFLLVSVRRGLASLPANVNYFFNADTYYSISNILVRPDTITVKPGTTIQFCGFPKFADGTVSIRDKDLLIPECVIEYDKFNSALKKSMGSRLRNANLACFVWQSTGGTITTETCSNQ